MARSEVANMLSGHRKRGGLKKTKMEVSVYIPASDEVAIASDDMKWLKKDLKREVERAMKYERVLKNWVPEDVAAMAKKEVEQKLAESKLRVREMKARIKLRS